jgi:hypothetical protein
MRQSMEKMDPDVVKKAMENMKFSMEEYTKKLDRTIDLLEQVKKEQSLQKTLEIAEEMQRMQEQLLQKTQNAKDTEPLAREQKAISDKLNNMREQLDKAESMLDPKKDAAMREMMEQMKEQMQQDDLQSDMSQSEQNLQQNQRQQSMQNQQSALQKMQSMTSSLKKMQQSMSQGSSMEVGKAMQEATRRMLTFSELHEKSAGQYVRDPFAVLDDQLANFEGIQLTIQKLFATPMVSLFITPKFFVDANFTNVTYKQMFSEINENRYSQVNKYLSDIQKGINLMVYDLMQSTQNAQSGGGGASMQGLMQMMQQMSDEQMAMNMLTQQLMQQMQSGGMSPGMRDQLGRIAANEEQLAENMRRMLQNDPEAQKQAGGLSKTADELEQIAKQIRQGRIDQDLIDRQERILSRMLDAQKSIHQREFSKERKAERSEHDDWQTPEETRMRFEEMRRKALLSPEIREYPREYQDLIKEYMRRLNANGQ